MVKEAEAREPYKIGMGSTSKDYFGYAYTFYSLCRQLGYGVELREKTDGEGQWLDIMAESDETAIKLIKLEGHTTFNELHILECVSAGVSWPLLEIMKETEDESGRDILKKCFMRAYLRNVEFDRETTEDYGEVYKDGVQRSRKAYEKFEEEGIEPIEPEQLAGMVISAIRRAISENPELKP